MQESFWWWQCGDRYIISLFPHLHTPFPPFSPSLISLMVSVDVKHQVYLLMSKSSDKWTNERLNECMNEGMNKWMNDWMNKRTNEYALYHVRGTYRCNIGCVQYNSCPRVFLQVRCFDQWIVPADVIPTCRTQRSVFNTELNKCKDNYFFT